MIKVNEQLLLDDLGYTATAFNSGVNRDFVKNNYERFISLNRTLLFNYDKYFLADAFFNDSYDAILDKNDYIALGKFSHYIADNYREMSQIANNYCDCVDKMNFYECAFWDVLRRYSEKDFKDVILGYFNTFGNDIYKIAKRYFDEGRINVGTMVDDATTGGYFEWLHWLDSGYVFETYDVLDSFTASVICHELGHAIDAERFVFPQKKNIPIFSDSLVEFPSKTFEIGFQNYLKNNYIDIDGSRILSNYETSNSYEYLKILRDALKSEDLAIDLDGFAVDVKTGDAFYIRHAILYGLGHYLAMHLNVIRESSNKEFLKVLNDIMTMRNEMSFKDVIERTGFSKDDFISGKYVLPKEEDNFMELKKRFKC